MKLIEKLKNIMHKLQLAGTILFDRKGVKDMALALLFVEGILDGRRQFNEVPKFLKKNVRVELERQGFLINEKGELVEKKA